MTDVTEDEVNGYLAIERRIEDKANAIIMRYRDLFREHATKDDRGLWTIDDSCLFVQFVVVMPERSTWSQPPLREDWEDESDFKPEEHAAVAEPAYLLYRGYESGAFDGCGDRTFNLPVSYLWNEFWEDDAVNGIRKMVADEKASRERSEAEWRATQIAERDRLIAKYGTGTQ